MQSLGLPEPSPLTSWEAQPNQSSVRLIRPLHYAPAERRTMRFRLAEAHSFSPRAVLPERNSRLDQPHSHSSGTPAFGPLRSVRSRRRFCVNSRVPASPSVRTQPPPRQDPPARAIAARSTPVVLLPGHRASSQVPASGIRHRGTPRIPQDVPTSARVPAR